MADHPKNAGDHASAAPLAGSARRTWPTLLLALSLALLALALFWPATRYGFINFDDDRYVSENSVVLRGLTPHGIRWAFTTVHELWWLPLLWISYMADINLFGPGPFGHHLTNVLLHAVNVALLFWFLFRLTGSRWRSAFVAALFAIHPLRIESVVWITERKDVLSGLFFFLALLAYLRQVERSPAAGFWILPMLMLLGLMAKSTLVILPFLLLLLDYWPLGRLRSLWGSGALSQWKPLLEEKIPLFGLSFLFIAITLCTHGTTNENAAPLSIWSRLTLIAPNYWDYLALIFWPADLSLIRPPGFPPGSLRLLAGPALLAPTFLFWRLRNRFPALLIGWLWFLGGLFPLIRGIRFDEQSAFSDRYAYLPSIGIGLMLAWGAGYLAERRKKLVLPLALLGLAALAACFWRSSIRLPDWKDSPTMFRRLIEYAPTDPHVTNGYGHELLKQGRIEEAMPYFVHAAALRPKTSTAVLNYADALVRLGRFEEVLAWLQAAREKGFPDAVEVKALSGLAHLGSGRAAEAVPLLRQAVQWRPAHPAWRVELIRALFEAGEPAAAQEEIRGLQALGIPHIRDFDSLAIHYAGVWQLGDAIKGWSFFRNNLRLQPDSIVLLNNAAWLLATMDRPPAPPEEALRYARHAVEIAPTSHPGLLDTLAAALAANGQYEEAAATVQQAIDLARKNGAEDLVRNMGLRLAVYRQNRPWREPPLQPPEQIPPRKPREGL